MNGFTISGPTRPVIGIIFGLFVVYGAWGSGDNAAGVVVGLAIAIGSGLFLRFAKAERFIIFNDSSGESNALKSKDKDLVDRVAAAVNDAIVARG